MLIFIQKYLFEQSRNCIFLLKIIALKNYFLQYRAFFIFLIKFFLVYGLLTVCYQYYLSTYNLLSFEPDGFTKFVAHQTEKLLQLFNDDSFVKPHERQASMKLIFNGKYVARIVEGCNAMSVMILFMAFVVAFKGKIKPTFLFILAGIVIIHILNVIRIALLASALYHYPQYEHLLHGVVFPLFIYGVVFALWVIWVQKFSIYGKDS